MSGIETDASSKSSDFRTVLDTLQDSYFEANLQGIVTYANRAFFENLGLPDRAAVVGRHFSRFTDARWVQLLYERFRDVYRSATPVPAFRYYFRPPGGDPRPGELSIAPILQDGVVVGSRGIIRDISSHVNAEQALREAKTSAEAQAAQLRAVNRVAQTVSKSLNLNRVLQAICEELTGLFPVRNAGVALITPDRRNMEVVAFHTRLEEEQSAIGLVLPFAGNPSSQEVIRSRKPMVLQDAQTDPRSGTLSAISRSRGTKAIMIVPILSRGEAIGTVGMPALDPNYLFTDAEVELAGTIATQIAAAVDNARTHDKTLVALDVAERDLELGREIQASFFPERIPKIDGWEVAGEFRAARQVAGDFYDVFRVPATDLTALVIGDVCDKGVGAALFMVLFRSLIRAFSVRRTNSDAPADALLQLVYDTNDYVARYHSQSNMFATMLICLLEHDTGVLHYVNAGHEPPIVVDASGASVGRLEPTGPAVGLLPSMKFQVKQRVIAPGEMLIGFTDGTTDARSAAGESFTEERLQKCVGRAWSSARSVLFELTCELALHSGTESQFDDITLLAVRRKERPSAPAIHTISRPALVDAVPSLREFVSVCATSEGLHSEATLALASSVDEICTNAAQHGYRGREPGVISVQLMVESGRLARLVITDDGDAFDPGGAEPPDLTLELEERNVGGLGIYLVREYVDRMTYERTDEGVNRLTLEVDVASTDAQKGE